MSSKQLIMIITLASFACCAIEKDDGSIDVIGFGVLFTKIGEASNVKNLPTISFAFPKNMPTQDVEHIQNYQDIIDACTTYTSVHPKEKIVKSACSQMKDVINHFDKMVNLVKEGSEARLEKRSLEDDFEESVEEHDREKRSGGIIGLAENILFGGEDYSKQINELSKGVKDNAMAIKETNKGLTALKKLENTDFEFTKKQFNTLGNKLNNMSSYFQERMNIISKAIDSLEGKEDLITRTFLAMIQVSMHFFNFAFSKIYHNTDIIYSAVLKQCVSSAVLPYFLKRSSVRDSLLKLQQSLRLKDPSLSIRFLSDLRYYYTSAEVSVSEDANSFIFTVSVPVFTSNTIIDYYKVTKYPVNQGDRSSIIQLQLENDCIGVTQTTPRRFASVRCSSLRVYKRIVLTEEVPLLPERDNLCLTALLDNNPDSIHKRCNFSIATRNPNGMYMVGQDTVLLSGEHKYRIICGKDRGPEKKCKDCKITIPCYCHVESNHGSSPLILGKCGYKQSVRYDIPRVLAHITHKVEEAKIPSSTESSNRVKIDPPRKWNFKILPDDVAEIEHKEYDLNRLIDQDVKGSNGHATSAEHHADKAAKTTGWGSTSSGIRIFEIIISIAVGGSYLLSFYLLFRTLPRSIATNVSFVELSGEIAIRSKPAITTEQAITSAILCLCTVITLCMALYKAYSSWKSNKKKNVSVHTEGRTLMLEILSDPPTTLWLNDDHMCFLEGAKQSHPTVIVQNTVVWLALHDKRSKINQTVNIPNARYAGRLHQSSGIVDNLHLA